MCPIIAKNGSTTGLAAYFGLAGVEVCNRSRQNLSSCVAGKKVIIDYSKRDRYKRILGKVLISGQDINLKQVEDGMAWHYKEYQKGQTMVDRTALAVIFV
jgi:hypothetical protein